MSFLILAQSNVTASALGACLEILGVDSTRSNEEPCLVLERFYFEREGGIAAYERAVSWLEGQIVQHGGGVSVLVDTVRPGSLSAVADYMSWDTLLALLILTFPEVRWFFGVVSGDEKEFQKTGHQLPALLALAKRNPIFDPTGLREWVRERTNETLEKENVDKNGRPMQLPLRGMLAAALDDEHDFAMIHGYTAYRYGFRVDTITSWALMEQQFGETRAKQPNSVHGYHLLLEDMRLAFPDKPGGVHLSDIKVRATKCPLLAVDRDRSEWRFLITSGQTGVNDSLLDDNREMLEDKRYGRGELLLKPIGGVCDLWKRTGLLKEFAAAESDNPRGNAPGFHWPPTEIDDDDYHGHAAAGKLGMVAAVLVKRAKAAKARADGAADFLIAALLASDAAELLGCKTPDLSLTALQLKHECEVRAECAFIGTGFHFELDQRLKEIKLEVNSVAKWSGSRRKAIDAKSTIIKEMREVYSDAGQMEEEDRCLVEFRSLNRVMGRPSRWWEHVLVVPWISHGILAYGEWLLSGFSKLLVMIALWVGYFVCLFRQVDGAKGLWEDNGWGKALGSVVGLFFGSGPDGDDLNNVLTVAISCGAVFVGVFHVGILMSYLYSLISRK